MPIIDDIRSYDQKQFFGKNAAPLVGFINEAGDGLTEKGQLFAHFCEKTGLSGHASSGYFFLRSPGLFELSFKGLLKMMFNTGNFSMVHAAVVLTGDEFSSGIRDNMVFIDHQQTGISSGITRQAKSGGQIVGFAFENIEGSYALAKQKDGNVISAVVNHSELLASMSKQITPESVWYKFPGEMAKKVALKRLAKIALLSGNNDDAISLIDLDNQHAA